MGFNVTDLRPARVTPITPPAKAAFYKIFEIADDEASGDQVKVKLPSQSSVVNVHVFGNTAGGSGDEMVVTITQGGTTLSTGTFDLETDGATGGDVTLPGLPNLASAQTREDIVISTNSTVSSGGPWVVMVKFVE